MTLWEILRGMKKAAIQHRRNRQTFDDLAHLDARLLRDMGLSREGGVVRPLEPLAFQLEKGNGAPMTGMPAPGARRSQADYCPHCGEALT
ncbi:MULTISPECIES: DUF1127 domain-containing protein [Chromohalobacter]|jgi:hypothetical protein|uniref:DUF1127 domain-containing protein n=1 Tax=Chromohalobacter TaxID=42054 RepID=UPI0005B9674C|nr:MULTISPECIES: DUF1127 domain-containing protein [Chromohalobacter]MDO0947255.1 DUF1127 domain-containing protein [Chromohalobacter salexigens]NQY46600.1 DUF1127 domain-containing protein [Chromohalobacter sp.]NWO57557.1 DUF1127 domain-containing protein [Chromohalobacter salexigens]PWW37711.1 uncharacterized protein DUF1127 [Chromohalobacter salexigens]